MRSQNPASATTTPAGRNPSSLIALGAIVAVAAAFFLSLSVASMIIGDVGGSVRAGLIGLLLGSAGALAIIRGRRRRARWNLERIAAHR